MRDVLCKESQGEVLWQKRGSYYDVNRKGRKMKIG